MGVSIDWQQAIKGLVLLGAVAFDVWNKKRVGPAGGSGATKETPPPPPELEETADAVGGVAPPRGPGSRGNRQAQVETPSS
jgi:putative multiple sugar transport system permease protein